MKPDAKTGMDAVAGFYKEVGVMTNKVRRRLSSGAPNSKKLLFCYSMYFVRSKTARNVGTSGVGVPLARGAGSLSNTFSPCLECESSSCREKGW